MIKSKELFALMPIVSEIKTRAANLYHNTKYRRVTHTLKTLVLLIRKVTEFRFETQTITDFTKELSYALYQSQSGPIEIAVDAEGDIFIRGVFKIDQLRLYLLVNKPIDTIQLEISEPTQ